MSNFGLVRTRSLNGQGQESLPVEIQDKTLTCGPTSRRVRSVIRKPHTLCTTQKGTLSLIPTLWLCSLLFAGSCILPGCGEEKQCPQGSEAEGDQCFLAGDTTDSIDILIYETALGEANADANAPSEDGQSADDATDSVATDSSPDVTGWEKTRTTPFWRHRVGHGSTVSMERDIDLQHIIVKEAIARTKEFPGYTNVSQGTAQLYPEFMGSCRETDNCFQYSAEQPAEFTQCTHSVDERRKGSAHRFNHVKEDVNQCRCRRESRRNCREWSIGQLGIGDSLQRTT